MRRLRTLWSPFVAVLAAALVLAAPSPAGAVISGANGWIAFVSDRDGHRQIWATRSDGTAAVELTSGSANNYDPSVSADGTKIAFISDRDGAPELYTMGIDGSAQTRLTFNGSTIAESHPSWAPNASAIAFAGVTGTDSEIYTVKPDGTSMINLTNSPTSFDAHPSWSPGGIKIAFDSTNRGGDTGTEIYTMVNNGTSVTKLTTDGKSSNPSWFPDNKNVAFESARDNFVPGPSLFASIAKPDGIAVTSGRVLVTQFTSDKVKSINDSGVVSTFATLPPTGLSVERYIAVSPGLGGFPTGDVYVTVGANVYQITPDGLTVTLFCTIATSNNGETGISFDTVGTYGFDMMLTDRTGPVWTCDSSGTATQVGDFQRQIEAPLVAPTSFVPYGGKLLAGSEFGNGLYVLNDGGTGSTLVGSWTGAEGAVLIPGTACNFGNSGGAYFVALKDEPNPQGGTGEIVKFGAGNFPGLGGDVLVGSETSPQSTGIGRFHSDGSTVTSSLFYTLGTTPDLEGSAFAPCTFGSPQGQQPSGVAGPHEIYKINTVGLAQTRLTNNSTDDANPAPSPDGQKIVFQSDRDNPGSGVFDLYAMNASDGSAQTNLSNNPANDSAPDWETVGAPVSVSDFVFTPSTSKPKQGTAVIWDFKGPSQHTATDDSGMGLFDSGIKNPGTYFVFKFGWAGSYPFDCTLHEGLMSGTIKVPMTAAPKSGNLTTVFTITWATTAPPTGYKFDVQYSYPGGPGFVDWKPLTTLRSGTFTADHGTGTYSFQARLHNTLNGFTSNYSTPVSITVNP